MRSRRKREEEKGAAEETEEEKEEEMGKKKNRRTHTYTHKNETWISLKERKNVDRAMTQNSTRSREHCVLFFSSLLLHPLPHFALTAPCTVAGKTSKKHLLAFTMIALRSARHSVVLPTFCPWVLCAAIGGLMPHLMRTSLDRIIAQKGEKKKRRICQASVFTKKKKKSVT